MRECVERRRLPWIIVRNDERMPARYHAEQIPCLVLIDARGDVAATDVSVSHLRGALRRLLLP